MARALPGDPQSRPARIVLAILRPLQHELVYWAPGRRLRTASAGVSLKLNTTCVKLAPRVEALIPSKIKNAAAAPITPPIAARINDSTSVPTKAGKPPKADRPQGGDLGRSRCHRRVHRVERTGERAE